MGNVFNKNNNLIWIIDFMNVYLKFMFDQLTLRFKKIFKVFVVNNFLFIVKLIFIIMIKNIKLYIEKCDGF